MKGNIVEAASTLYLLTPDIEKRTVLMGRKDGALFTMTNIVERQILVANSFSVNRERLSSKT